MSGDSSSPSSNPNTPLGRVDFEADSVTPEVAVVGLITSDFLGVDKTVFPVGREPPSPLSEILSALTCSFRSFNLLEIERVCLVILVIERRICSQVGGLE